MGQKTLTIRNYIDLDNWTSRKLSNVALTRMGDHLGGRELQVFLGPLKLSEVKFEEVGRLSSYGW